MALNFTAADRVGGIGGYIGGIATLLNMAGGFNAVNGCSEGDLRISRSGVRVPSGVPRIKPGNECFRAFFCVFRTFRRLLKSGCFSVLQICY